jgi:hypothetical protein
MQDASVPKGPGLDIHALLAEFESSHALERENT